MAILITTYVCNLKYYVHANRGTVSTFRTYTFGNTCLWSTFMETSMCGNVGFMPKHVGIPLHVATGSTEYRQYGG
jgi:hypothetical protein